MALKYDGTINAGHIMTAVTLLVTAIGAVFYVQADLRSLSENQARMEAAFNTEIISIRQDATDRAARLRAAELTIAGQTSDLRAISASLSRIERLLEAKD